MRNELQTLVGRSTRVTVYTIERTITPIANGRLKDVHLREKATRSEFAPVKLIAVQKISFACVWRVLEASSG